MTGSEGANHSGTDDSQRSTGPQLSATEHEEYKFAKELTEDLRGGRVNHDFDHLVLVAAPRFLAKLQGSVDEPTRKTVSHSLVAQW